MSGRPDVDPGLNAVDRVLFDWSRRIRLFCHLAPGLLYVAELERIFRHWASGGDMTHLLLAKVTMDTLKKV
jgi:hypothetical protein